MLFWMPACLRTLTAKLPVVSQWSTSWLPRYNDFFADGTNGFRNLVGNPSPIPPLNYKYLVPSVMLSRRWGCGGGAVEVGLQWNWGTNDKTPLSSA